MAGARRKHSTRSAVGRGLLAFAVAVEPAILAAGERSLPGDRPPSAAQSRPASTEIAYPQTHRFPEQKQAKTVRLNFFHATWDQVLKKVAESSGSTLVMTDVPTGRFTRRDHHSYTRTDAIRVLNRELEPMGFRVLERGEFLDLLHVRALRARYGRPALLQAEAADAPRSQAPLGNASPRSSALHGGKQSFQKLRSEAELGNEIAKPGTPQRAFPTGDGDGDGTTTHHSPLTTHHLPATTHQKPVEPNETVVVSAQKRRAVDLARIIYDSLKPRSELIERGPQDLPAFRVFRSTPQRAGSAAGWRPSTPGERDRADEKEIQFSVGIDMRNDELAVEGPRRTVLGIAALIRELDSAEESRGRTVRLVSYHGDPAAIARGLQPALDQLAQAQPPSLQVQPPQEQPAPKEPPEPREPPQPAPRPEDVPPGDVPPLTIRGLRGPVTIRDVPGVGLVITGNREDVEEVMRIIRELDLMAGVAAPEIRLHRLRYVDSRAMAELLNNVYAELTAIRSPLTQERRVVSIIPISRPNSILIIASKGDLTAILKLVEELDTPVDPSAEFQVFRLEYAVPSQVVAAIESTFAAQPAQAQQPQATAGLGPRVTAFADPRTNSVIVQARPRDMAQVALLIRRLDRDNAGAVNRVRVFPLRHTAATELANTINTAIQSVLSPPPPPAAQPGVPGAPVPGVPGAPGAAAGQVAPQVREPKSAVLEFLTTDGDVKRLVRSGILADIRVTADPRANSLIVSATEQSMQLMEALIEFLDQPTNIIADIKVFTLTNSDATAMRELLEALFQAQVQAGAPGQPGQAGLPGIQLAGVEDAASGLVPLRFSVDVRTNSLIAIGGPDALGVVEAIILRLDQAESRQRRTTVVRLRNSPVADVGAAINAFLQSQRQLAAIDPELVSNIELLEREIIVVPEPVTNSLLISATPRFYDEIQRIIAQLDEAPPQVIIQALLVEVELDNTDEFGVELGFQDDVLFDRGVVENLQTISETITLPQGTQTTTQRIISQERVPGFNFNNQPLGNNAVNPSTVGEQLLSNFSLGRVNSDLGFGGLVISASSQSISVLLRALASQRTIHILSRPQIRTLDNQLAQIHVGQEVPVVDGFTPATATTGPTPLVRRDAAGILLTVTPRISPEGMIVMETIAEKSAFPGASVPLVTDPTTGVVIESPIKTITAARTTVSVPNGQTIVLGGMITKTDNTLQRKVPYLADIPLLGRAFRYDSTRTQRTELLIFLTPRIIRTDGDSELIKQIEAERLHFIEQEAESMHGPLFAVPPQAAAGPEWCPPIVPGQMDPVYPLEVPGPLEMPAPYGTPAPFGTPAPYGTPIPFETPPRQGVPVGPETPVPPVLPVPPPPANDDVPTTIMPGTG